MAGSHRWTSMTRMTTVAALSGSIVLCSLSCADAELYNYCLGWNSYMACGPGSNLHLRGAVPAWCSTALFTVTAVDLHAPIHFLLCPLVRESVLPQQAIGTGLR